MKSNNQEQNAVTALPSPQGIRYQQEEESLSILTTNMHALRTFPFSLYDSWVRIPLHSVFKEIKDFQSVHEWAIKHKTFIPKNITQPALPGLSVRKVLLIFSH